VPQDDIPPFPTSEALATIEADLGAPVATIFMHLTPKPVAAASLGQVYKATLVNTGAAVAIKVQRPGLLPAIALDIFILRNCAKVLRQAKSTNSDLAALIDEWAASIYREMSYVNELSNGVEFKQLFSHYPEV
jgi:aarF domain-containing kinase